MPDAGAGGVAQSSETSVRSRWLASCPRFSVQGPESTPDFYTRTWVNHTMPRLGDYGVRKVRGPSGRLSAARIYNDVNPSMHLG
jgi:hypothetical protein